MPLCSRRQAPLRKNEERGRIKKSTGLGTIASIAQAWAEAYPSAGQSRIAALSISALIGTLSPNQVTGQHIASLLGDWRKKYARHTAYTLTVRLRSLLRFIRGLGHQDLLPIVPRMRTPASRTVYATAEELARLHAHAEPWLRCFLLLTGHLGMRLTAAMSVAPANYSAEAHAVTIRLKGGDPMVLPTTPELDALFAQAPTHADPTISYIQLLRGTLALKGDRISNTTVRQSFYRLVRKAQVNPKLRPHDLHRTVAMAAYAKSRDIFAVKELLGHANISTTAKYLANRNIPAIRETIDSITKTQCPQPPQLKPEPQPKPETEIGAYLN